MRNETTAWKVKYETGPCANDCYSLTVYANTMEAAQRVVESKYPKAYVTEVERVKESKMEQKYMGAMEARALTEKAKALEGEYKRAETEELLAIIATAAKKGNESIQTDKLDKVVEQRLRNLGYKVEWTAGFGQREPGYTTISW